MQPPQFSHFNLLFGDDESAPADSLARRVRSAWSVGLGFGAVATAQREQFFQIVDLAQTLAAFRADGVDASELPRQVVGGMPQGSGSELL